MKLIILSGRTTSSWQHDCWTASGYQDGYEAVS